MTTLASHIHAVVAYFALGQIQTITPLQPGFVAHAHRVQTTTHDVMIKTYDRTRAITARMLEYAPFYLHVTDYLATQTPVHGRIGAPLACPDGTFLYDDTQFVSAVFAYLPGITPRNNPLTTAQHCDTADHGGADSPDECPGTTAYTGPHRDIRATLGYALGGYVGL